MRNPYDILGVPKGSNQQEVKRAYRKLAKVWHPDHNADNPKAKEKFAEINAAYEILGDDKKRAQFDGGEIDAEGKPRFQGFEGFNGGGRGAGPGGFEQFSFNGGNPFGNGATFGGGSTDDILSALFGGARRSRQRQARGADINVSLTVTLEDIGSEEKKRLRMPSGRSIDVQLPKGVTDGQVIRLRGLGDEPPGGGQAGDALLTVRIATHPKFKVDGSDLRLQLPVEIEDAVLGGTVRIPTLTGTVEMKIPPRTDSGRIFRLKGKGLPGKSGVGDLLATVEIHLPNDADETLAEYARRRRGAKAEVR